MTLMQLSVGLAASNELDKFSLNSHNLSQGSSPTNSSLLTCDSRPHSANKILLANGIEHDQESSSELLGLSPSSTSGDDLEQHPITLSNHHRLHHHHRMHHSNSLVINQLRSSPLIEGREQAGLSLPLTLDENVEATHQHNNNNNNNQVRLQPARRPSRCEHRKSLSDLGYGKIESYARLQKLGKGTYATVYLGRSKLSNDLVALKEILKEHDEGAPCTAIREISLLRLLRHNNIVTLHDICHTPKKLTLVFEYVGPDLYAYMREYNNLLSVNNIRVSCNCIHLLHQRNCSGGAHWVAECDFLSRLQITISTCFTNT